MEFFLLKTFNCQTLCLILDIQKGLDLLQSISKFYFSDKL